MVESGKPFLIQHDQGMAEIVLIGRKTGICRYEARWTPVDADPLENSGLLNENFSGGDQLTVGPLQLKWSAGDATRSWIFLPESGVKFVENPASWFINAP